MKKHISLISNILLIFIGLLGLKTPYLTQGLESAGIGGFLDSALLQPLFIVFVIAAVYGQVIKIKETLSFMPIILNLVFGILAFVFVFPAQNLIVGYISLAAIFLLIFWPLVKNIMRKKKIVTIKV